MADPEIATKAPESDAQTSPITNDTPAQSGPSMGEHCTTDRPLPSHGNTTPTGEITTLNKIECYISKPSSYPHSPSRLLLLLTGGTGIHSTNNQLQADAYAARGFLVVMPDQFTGDAAPTTTTAPAQGEEPSIIERVKMGAAETAKSFMLDMWLARHDVEKVMPILQATLEGAREEFADAVANGGGIYGVGYCFGAKYILLLCGSHSDSVKHGQKRTEEDVEQGEVQRGPELRAGAIAHGTLVTKADVEGVRAPVAMACVQNDSLFPDEIREQGKASLELNAVDHNIQVFEGVPHGFAVLGDYADQHIEAKQKEAFEMMCEWLETH
ncbi:MAG: hypothetical protein M1828_003017 [Chrysothrix sp. TS-e1954]|nr:MAG: hypothetical protein M1828_003017 [Chrysothrix sp. TS-e1954]